MQAGIWNSISGGRRTLAIMLAASTLFICAEQALSESPDPELPSPPEDDRVEKIELRSFPLATPMTLPGDPLKEQITAIQIKGEAPTGGDGSAQLSLDSSELTFNEFGDAEVVEARPHRMIFVKLIRHAREEPDSSLFEISSPLLLSKQKVLLLVEHHDHRLSHLLIGTLGPPATNGDQSFSEVESTPLRNDLFSPKGEEPHAALRDNIAMHTSQYPRIQLQGQLGSDGTLMHDQNHVGYSWLANRIARYSTCLAFVEKPLRIEPIDLPDPLQQGRRLFRLALATPSELGDLSLVVSPWAAGPHRLIIGKSGQSRRVLPLTPNGFGRWVEHQSAFSQLPPSEQNAITEISDASSTSYFHDYLIRSGHVSYLSLRGEHANREALAQLRDLPHLAHLSISSSNVAPDVLANALSDLKEIASLQLYELRYTPELLEVIGKLPKLEWLTISNVPETPLANESLWRLTAGAHRLKDLDLAAFGPTDEGLVSLAQLPSLKTLYLSAPQASEEGLKRLRDSMPNCKTHIDQLGE